MQSTQPNGGVSNANFEEVFERWIKNKNINSPTQKINLRDQLKPKVNELAQEILTTLEDTFPVDYQTSGHHYNFHLSKLLYSPISFIVLAADVFEKQYGFKMTVEPTVKDEKAPTLTVLFTTTCEALNSLTAYYKSGHCHSF